MLTISFVVCHGRYKFDTPFEREIKKEVFAIVHRGKEFATFGYLFRVCLYVSFYFYMQSQWLTFGPTVFLAITYGVAQALIGMNVQHDANHGAVSGKHHWMNDMLGFGADFIGGSKWLWIEQHWTHHTFTNHAEKDPDSYGAEPLVNFNDYPPGHADRKWFHHYQAFYYILVLGGYWLAAVFNPQVLDLRQRGAQRVGIQMESPFLQSRRKFAVALRLLYIYIHVIYPIQYFGLTVSVISNILLMGFCESLTLAVLFSLSHNFEHVDRDPTQETKQDTNGKVCWFKSQVETSSTYGGFISGCVTGGLNFQIEHHLFPRMSSAWYPYIAPVVRKVCQKHGVRYTHYPWVFQNLWSTIQYMHQAGTGINWKDGNPYTGKL
jgi:acyl-lipid (7-3)-desaturase (Delta-4 desaturase)